MHFAPHNRPTVQSQMYPIVDQAMMLLVLQHPSVTLTTVMRTQILHPWHHSAHLLHYHLQHLQSESTQHSMTALQIFQTLSKLVVQAHMVNDNTILHPVVQWHIMASVMFSITFMGHCVIVRWHSLIITEDLLQNTKLKQQLFYKIQRHWRLNRLSLLLTFEWGVQIPNSA